MQTGRAFARGLQRLRKLKGLTQAQLAETSDLSVQMVAALEQQDKAPSISSIDSICKALGVQPSELFAAGEAKNSPDDAAQRITVLLRGLSREDKAGIADVVAQVTTLLRAPKRRRSH